MLLAGIVVAVANVLEPWSWGRWIALHLIFVGGISQLVLGAGQFFAGAFLATDPPARRWVRAQFACWNAGTVLLAVSVPLRSEPFTWLAVALLCAALVSFAASLLRMRRDSLQSAPWATRWYLAAASCLGIGIAAGGALATGLVWTHGNLLGAHMALNVGGWFGTAIVGTLHTFYPSLTRTGLAHPRLQAPTFGLWIGGVATLAIGYGWLVGFLVVAGWVSLAASSALLLTNVVGSLRAAPRPVSLPARTLAVAQLLLLAGLSIACFAAFSSGPWHVLAGSTRAAVGTLLLAGWVGLTVLGSLLHLLAVVIRVRDLRRPMPAPQPGLDLLVTAASGAGIVALTIAQLCGLQGLRLIALLTTAVAYVWLAARVATLAARVAARARPSI